MDKSYSKVILHFVVSRSVFVKIKIFFWWQPITRRALYDFQRERSRRSFLEGFQISVLVREKISLHPAPFQMYFANIFSKVLFNVIYFSSE